MSDALETSEVTRKGLQASLRPVHGAEEDRIGLWHERERLLRHDWLRYIRRPTPSVDIVSYYFKSTKKSQQRKLKKGNILPPEIPLRRRQVRKVLTESQLSTLPTHEQQRGSARARPDQRGRVELRRELRLNELRPLELRLPDLHAQLDGQELKVYERRVSR